MTIDAPSIRVESSLREEIEALTRRAEEAAEERDRAEALHDEALNDCGRMRARAEAAEKRAEEARRCVEEEREENAELRERYRQTLASDLANARRADEAEKRAALKWVGEALALRERAERAEERAERQRVLRHATEEASYAAHARAERAEEALRDLLSHVETWGVAVYTTRQTDDSEAVIDRARAALSGSPGEVSPPPSTVEGGDKLPANSPGATPREREDAASALIAEMERCAAAWDGYPTRDGTPGLDNAAAAVRRWLPALRALAASRGAPADRASAELRILLDAIRHLWDADREWNAHLSRADDNESNDPRCAKVVDHAHGCEEGDRLRDERWEALDALHGSAHRIARQVFGLDFHAPRPAPGSEGDATAPRARTFDLYGRLTDEARAVLGDERAYAARAPRSEGKGDDRG